MNSARAKEQLVLESFNMKQEEYKQGQQFFLKTGKLKTIVENRSQKQTTQDNNSILQSQQSLQKKRKKSFSPVKNFKLIQQQQEQNKLNINSQRLSALQNPPTLVHSLPSQQAIKINTIPTNPVKLLLQNHPNNLQNPPQKRSQQQISLIIKLLQQNKIFKDINFDKPFTSLTNSHGNIQSSRSLLQSANNKNSNHHHQSAYFVNMLKQIGNSIVLLWNQAPNITEIKTNQVYLILEGKTFQYIHNDSTKIKLKIHQNNDYIMIRKLIENDYFVSIPQIVTTNKNKAGYGHINNQLNPTKASQKYQLMADQKTLIGKISDELFFKYFHTRIYEKTKYLIGFLKKVSLFENLPVFVFQQLGKFVKLRRFIDKEMVIQLGEKSKDIYFVKQGKVEFKLIARNQGEDGNDQDQEQVSVLEEYDVFGMDTLHTIKTTTELIVNYSAMSISPDCQLYCIDKRILAIVISSFQKQLKIQQKIIPSININSQIKGQNYLSHQQQILSRNAERIKTSQKKIRDVKLQSYSRKNKRSVNTYIPQKDRISQQNKSKFKFKSQSQQTKLKSTAGFNLNLGRNKSLIQQTVSQMNLFRESNDSRFSMLKNKFNQERNMENMNGKKQVTQTRYFTYSLTALDEPENEMNNGSEIFMKRNMSLFSNSSLNQFQKVKRNSIKNMFETLKQNSNNKITKPVTPQPSQSNLQAIKPEFMNASRSFIPKIKTNTKFAQNPSTNLGKIQSDLIKTYIDKKLKDQIIRKTNQVLQRKSSTIRHSTKNLKNLFNMNILSPTKKQKQIQKLLSINKKSTKQITDELFQRMTNMNQYPLLCKIQNQRRKMNQIQKNTNSDRNRKSPQKNNKQDGQNVKSQRILIFSNNQTENASINNMFLNVKSQQRQVIQGFSSDGSRIQTEKMDTEFR